MRGRRAVIVGVLVLAGVAACGDDGDGDVDDGPAAVDVRFALRPVVQGGGCADLGGPTPAPDADDRDASVVLPSFGEPLEDCYRLGPVPTLGTAVLAGAIVEGPEATEVEGTWGVDAGIVEGALPALNAVAADCFEGDPTVCPTRQLAIVLDGVVISVPFIDQPSFDTSGFSIRGDFTETQARDLVTVLEGG